MPKCPNCGAEVATILYWSKGEIEYGGNIKRDGWWWMQDREINFQCPHCFVPLDPNDLDKLGVPEDMR